MAPQHDHGHVCPWWLGYLLASPIRRLVQNPEKILKPFVREGFHVLEVGPGMGFFTLPLAAMVGPRGKIIAVDIQNHMVNELARRVAKAGYSDRVTCSNLVSHLPASPFYRHR
ncbi:MAG: class I SAM-dependent methyltransferase [Chitinivibrionales bacterium]|nr:class I SAM-dependent methyltransferase [Chitinivibrionales bacterium]